MARYFFVYVNERGRSHDHQGRDFSSLDSAKRQGEFFVDRKAVYQRFSSGTKT